MYDKSIHAHIRAFRLSEIATDFRNAYTGRANMYAYHSLPSRINTGESGGAQKKTKIKFFRFSPLRLKYLSTLRPRTRFVRISDRRPINFQHHIIYFVDPERYKIRSLPNNSSFLIYLSMEQNHFVCATKNKTR